MTLFLKRSLTCRLSKTLISSFVENNYHQNIRHVCSSHHLHSAAKESRIKTYVTTKYVKYLDRFEQQFKSSLPSAHKLYRLFKDGTWELFSDTKEYYGVYMKIRSGSPLSSFTCKQLHLYQQLPGDLVKSVPLIIAIAIPFVQYLILPLAYYMYPKALLCRYFWSEGQLKQFSAQDLESRFKHYPNIINFLNMHCKEVSEQALRQQLTALTSKLMGNDIDIRPEEITSLKALFCHLPFSLEHLSKRHKIHMWHLCKSMEVRSVHREMQLFRHIDLALHHEGLDNVDLSLLKQIGLKRGINAYQVSEERLKQYLSKWLQVSVALDASHTSLLLHTPVLLNSQAYT